MAADAPGSPGLPGGELPGAAPPSLAALRGLFHSDEQLRLNQRRMEMLVATGLDPRGVRVLEVGAGLGDLSAFYLDRGCKLTITEGRPELVAVIRAGQSAAPQRAAGVLDLDQPPPQKPVPFGVVCCMGVLHLTQDPEAVLSYLRTLVADTGYLLVELVVAPGRGEAIAPGTWSAASPDGPLRGSGHLATRAWVWARLARLFAQVYAPRCQPNHPAFPTDWSCDSPAGECRAIFVASAARLVNDALTDALPDRQPREGL